MKREVVTLMEGLSFLFTENARQAHPSSSLLLVTLVALTLGHAGSARADLLDGLQLHIEFEDNVVDSSSNGFDGQASGDLQYADGAIGRAAVFDGVDDQVLFPTFSDALIADNDFSLSFWFNLPSGSILSVFAKREICDINPFFDIRMNSNRSMSLEVSDIFDNYFVASPATTSGWHHVAFTRSGTDLQAFLDGVLVDQELTPTTLDLSNMAALGLSNSPCVDEDGTQMLEGSLDDLRLYNRLLTNIEVIKLASIFSDGFESGDTSAWTSTVP